MTSTTSGEPAELSWCISDAILADGGTVRIRPMTAADGPGLVAFHGRLSHETVYLRFFSAHPRLSPEEVERFTHVDYRDRMALVATLRGQIVAVARYDRTERGGAEAEVAFVVDDANQGRGLGTILLEHLAAYARSQGIDHFVADTLPHNQRMLEVFRQAGFAREAHLDRDVVRVTMDIASTEATVEAIEARWRHAAARSIERLLRPRSVAVIGAARTPGTIGHEVFRNLINGGFEGPVYPVHPDAAHIASVKAYPNIGDVPGEVDLAVVVVPAAAVPAVIEECAAKNVKGLVVISAGFAETGTTGTDIQGKLVATAREAGMRLIGPNCMGVINTAPDVSLNATFAPAPPHRGRVAFASQSGGLGIAVLQEAGRRNLGLSSFVSMGNKADVSSNDLVRYWESDPATEVILLYLESFGNPRRFARIAREVSRSKPIVAVKAGRSRAGTRAASSHTAALAAPDSAVDALFTQAGVIRVTTLDELFGVAQILANQPLPTGNGVAIIGNSGGPCILAADACEGAGLEVPELSADTQAQLKSFLRPDAGVRNPVDMVASASADDFRRAIDVVLGDESVDAVLAVFTPPLVTDADDVARAIAEVAESATKPIIANFLGVRGVPGPLQGASRAVPSFSFPEAAAVALGAVSRYTQWRARPIGLVPSFKDVQPAAASAIVRVALAGSPSGLWLDPVEASSLLGTYGIPVAAVRFAEDARGAGAAAAEIGFPVALKAASPQLVHKSDVGGVRLGLGSENEVAAAFSSMASSLGDSMGGAVVQGMVGEGVETIVGVVHDPSFGPLVMFGTGGTAVELLDDLGFRILPMTDLDAAELVRSLRSSPLLFGYRGAPTVDVAGLEELILRVARLAYDVPEIAEMDLNPVIVSNKGAVAVDTKIRLVPAPPEPDPSLRRMR